MPHASVNGQRIYYEDTGGGGLSLVLAHGLLMDHEMFAAQVAALAPGHRVVTWDERGHGLTETTPEVRQVFRTLVGRDDITGRLAEIAAPALVIHGEGDIAIDLGRAQALVAGLPNARPLVRVPGAGHAANLTHPEPVNEAIARFLGEVI